MTPILVCESVRATSMAGLVRARDAVTEADIVELRLDGVDRPDVAQALAGRTRPVIVTCRPRWEGGSYDGDETDRRQMLEAALAAGAEFVDVEFAAPWRAAVLGRWKDRVVLSWHDFTGTPDDLGQRVDAMLSERAAVTKVAVTTRRLQDLGPLLGLRHRDVVGRQMVVIGMGPSGVATRVLPQRFGSCWTYGGAGVAPGQVPVSRLCREFRVRGVTPTTALFGVLGRPVGHSVSPAIHNAAFAECGIDAVYVPFEAESFEDFAWAADALDVAGVSVTAPFKRVAFESAASADPVSESLGVANTLRRDAQGHWEAGNTDVEGFLRPLRHVPLVGCRATVLGAGGAARAVVVGLSQRGARVTVVARRLEAARELADRFGADAAPWPQIPGQWDLLVNTTPVGTWPGDAESPVEASILHDGTVYDLVYNPPETALLKAAREAGCATVSGLEMLVTQAARQFEWWTGRVAPLAAMRQAAERRLDEYRAEGARDAQQL